MKDTIAEVTMTRADTISGELVQKLQALGVRGGILLQALFYDRFQIRNAFHQILQVVHRRSLINAMT